MKPINQLRILIIEDDDMLRQSVADLLELNDFSVVVARDGNEGLQLARRDLPSLIITDVNMPGLTGFDVLEALRKDMALRAIPVIVISAKADREATRRGMELGAADFITKPFTENELLHSIASRMERQELLDELEAFGHTVAHDLKNPLATLMGRIGLTRLLLDSADKVTLRRQLDEADKAATRLANIIDELLILSGVLRQAVVLRPLDMAKVVAEAVDRLESELKQYSAQIETPATWSTAVGHAPWIMEVWVNYISNAAKYGGPSPLIRLSSERVEEGRFVRFCVTDTGPGLDEAAQAQLFVPFTRIATVRSKGHGLGLSIVRRIVEKHDGRVGITSHPGQGATFWFELPVEAPKGSLLPISA